MSEMIQDDKNVCPYCLQRWPVASPEHMAALRAALRLWNYAAGDYHGTPLATVPHKLAELLAILEGES